MFIAIAAAIREENIHLFKSDRIAMGNYNGTAINGSTITDEMPSLMDMDESIHICNHLWYMLVAGYILPICGILTFFIVTYYWVQEFPIGICVDVMSGIFQTPDIDDLWNIGRPDEGKIEKQSKVERFINLAELTQQFKDFRRTDMIAKYMYPFQSLQTVILSIIYTTLQAVFVIFALGIVGGNPIWILFCLAASFIGFIANFHVFTVALGWALLLSFVLMCIAFILVAAVIFFACYLFVQSFNEEFNRRQR